MKLKSLILTLALIFSYSPSFAADEKVNINTANAATLDQTLEGVGPKKAAAIVTYREVNGDFARVEDLANVNGIGPKLLARNKDKITVGVVPATQSTPPAPKPTVAETAVPPATAASPSGASNKMQ